LSIRLDRRNHGRDGRGNVDIQRGLRDRGRTGSITLAHLPTYLSDYPPHNSQCRNASAGKQPLLILRKPVPHGLWVAEDFTPTVRVGPVTMPGSGWAFPDRTHAKQRHVCAVRESQFSPLNLLIYVAECHPIA
jgi:hypothetical protein